MPVRYAKPAICLFLIIATLAVYWQVQGHEFLAYDDPSYITENFMVLQGLKPAGAAMAFTATHADNWHPLTWLSHMLDYQVYGSQAGGHHLTNVLLHVANSVLLFLLLARLTAALWPSALVAALFALHPLHVESVAWVSERKDVLSAFFFLTTIWAYVRYVAAPSLGRYLGIIFSFALGLMAKPMLVTLPLVLLLLDYWPLGRLQPAPVAGSKRRRAAPLPPLLSKTQVLPLIWEKAPLLGLTGVSCLLTLVAQKKSMASMQELTILTRAGNALVAYVSYLGKMLWPLNLAVFYPHPGNNLPLWQAGAAGLLLAGITWLVIKKARAHPYLPVGWFWYLVMLVPVIGLVQVGEQALADRYTYLPLIGIFMILAWGLADLTAAWRRQRAALAVAAGLLLSLLMALTWVQAGYWRNTLSVFEHAAQVTENNHQAHCFLIDQYGEQGRLEEAVAMFAKTIRHRPGSAEAYNNLGNAYAHKGMTPEAIAMFQQAIQLKPDYPEAYNSLGIYHGRQGHLDEAVTAIKKAIQLRPVFSEAYVNLGIAYSLQGRHQEAMAMFQQALKINPANDGAHKMLQLVKEHAGS